LLRARTLNPQATVTDRNLACANVEQITTRDAIAERFPATGKIEHRRSPGRV
jgi:hypothetical protein